MKRSSQTRASLTTKSPVERRAIKSDPKLWAKFVAEERESDRGGRRGTWSARKAQMATIKYQNEMKKRGKKPYLGRKSSRNSLGIWTRQNWGYVDTDDVRKKRSRRGRYFPERVRKSLSRREKESTNRRKRAATRRGESRSKYTKKEARLVRNS